MRPILAAAALLILAASAADAAQVCRNGSCHYGGAYRVEQAYHAPAHVYPAPQVQALAAYYVPPHAYQERGKGKVRRRLFGRKGCCK